MSCDVDEATGGLDCYSKLLSLEVATVLDSCLEVYYEQ